MQHTTHPQTRQLTICSKSFKRKKNRYVFFPEIHLRGKWLGDIGFKSGHTLDITCEN